MKNYSTPRYTVSRIRKAPARRFKRLQGYKGALTRALNTSTDGAYVTLDLKTVNALIAVLDRNILEAKETNE